MKIVFVTPYPDNSKTIAGGVAGVSYYLANALFAINAGIELSVVVPAFSGDYHISSVGPVTVHYLPVGKPLPALFANATIFRWRLFRLLRRLQPDIVHFQGLAAWGINCPVPAVFTVHGIPENNLLYSSRSFVLVQRLIMKLIERVGRRQMRDVIAISPFVLEELAGQFTGRIHMIANPVDEGYFGIERKVERPVILYGGHVVRGKNVLGLLQAFRLVARAVPNTLLRIAGSHPDAGYLIECRAFLESHRLQDKVQFLGELNLPQLQSAFAGASVVALLSFQETAPLVVAEAMAAGVPVVTSKAGGLPYMVRHGKNGFLTDTDNPEEAAGYLIRLLRDRDLNRTMGKAARSYAREQFHPRIVARKTLQVYHTRLADDGERRDN
ncbi:MAG: glycosyltransferase family 4 protein [Deltaproteobacteria bacterium]|nr:glycosyltransferase family 4 protein [Deltaproteobacteria bacterium]